MRCCWSCYSFSSCCTYTIPAPLCRSSRDSDNSPPLLLYSTLILRLRYRLAAGVTFHVIAILSCLAFHFAWKCVRDWSAVQLYLAEGWTHCTSPIDGKLEEFAKRLRKQAEEPTLFYLLGIVPLV